MENIVTLVTQTATHESGQVLLGFGNTLYGIRSPFKGAFILNVAQDITAYATDTVKVDNIYGDARTLYSGDNAVTASELPKGMYMLSYDTANRKLHLVGSLSQPQPTPPAAQTGTRVLQSFVEIGTTSVDVLLAEIPQGKSLVIAQFELTSGSGSTKQGNMSVWLSDGSDKTETVYSSAEVAVDGSMSVCISAIIDSPEGPMEVYARARATAIGFGIVPQTYTHSLANCTKMEWVKL